MTRARRSVAGRGDAQRRRRPRTRPFRQAGRLPRALPISFELESLLTSDPESLLAVFSPGPGRRSTTANCATGEPTLLAES